MIYFNFSVDVESYGFSDEEVLESVMEIMRFSEDNELETTFFVTGELIERNPIFFKSVQDQGFEVACHGYKHERFDELDAKEIKSVLKKVKTIAKKAGIKLKGFRAPQHSIRKKDLSIVHETGFLYDSSVTSMNFMQFMFFPKKLFLNLSHFLSRPYPYQTKGVIEVPTTSVFIPLVSLAVRLMPEWIVRLLFRVSCFTTKGNVLFYVHNWDFLELPNSRAYRLCPKEKFLKKLSNFIEFVKSKAEPKSLDDIVSLL